MLIFSQTWICAPTGMSRGRFHLRASILRRPYGFEEFIRKQGFHSIYLVTTETDNPVKVGIAKDPVKRLCDLQSANFTPIRLHRFWWMPGKKITVRIESAFKNHFQSKNIRGEWFDLPLPTAEAFIEASIRSLGTWGVRHSDLIKYMDYREREKCGLPPDAPSPLAGIKLDM